MKRSKPLVFFGTESFSAASLKALIDQGWPIGLVVTKPDFKRGRGQKLNEPLAKTVARANSIPVTQPQKLIGIKNELADIGADFGVLVAYGKIIPEAIIDLFPGGIVNLHPSLLPKYRGPAPVEAAILGGDKFTGLSLMKLSVEMDAGPVYAQQIYELTGHETQPELYNALAQTGAELLTAKLDDIVGGRLEPIEQDEDQATYTKLLSKNDGLLNFNKPAEQLEREVRAFASWPRSRATILGQEVIVTKTRVVSDKGAGALVLDCQPGFLEVMELIAPSGRAVSGKDFILGYKNR
ncbi:MAG TPA: methionyl-tRNA formyltransferase [Candidatus Saccharimonadales bacterium]|nr:methionyl-tRNA formyltransferase [Candidatus Saccharimonadales bacterium]